MEKSAIEKRTKAEKSVFLVVFILFTIYSITLVYPFIWTFLSSLKTNSEFFDNTFALPNEWLFQNFIMAFKELKYNGHNLIEMTFNSIWFTVGGTLLSTSVGCMTAYVVCKYEFWGRHFIYSLAVFIMIITKAGSLPALYRKMNTLHLTNSPLIMLTFTGGFGFHFIILYGYFKNISWSYAEAAFVDGAGHYKVFLSIMVPQAKPALISVALIQSIGIWNDYMTPILFLKDFPTLASGIFRYQTIMTYQMNYPVLFAGVLLSIIPIMIVFILFQNTMMENMVAGGLKG